MLGCWIDGVVRKVGVSTLDPKDLKKGLGFYTAAKQQQQDYTSMDSIGVAFNTAAKQHMIWFPSLVFLNTF